MTAHGADQRRSVLIAGGGVAGLEALLALDHLVADRAAITLLSAEREFTYKPLMVEEPFLLGVAERRELAPLAEELGVRFVHNSIAAVEEEQHRIQLSDGSALSFELLLVCVGGRFHAPFKQGFTFPPAGQQAFGIDDWLGAAERQGDPAITFIVPPGVSWPLPLYELALMTQRRAGQEGRALRLSLVTPESAPLIMFGTAASEAVSALLRARGIELICGASASEADDGRLRLMPGERELGGGVPVALALLDGPRLAGLPQDEGGFIPIDEHARVRGMSEVYAAGDGTSFPIKQGGIATQQADTAAEHIAARLGAELEPRPFHPVLRGMLLTGEESLSMQHEPAGGGGEGRASEDYLWWPPHKISGRYLAAWLAGETPRAEPDPPRRSLEVEVALPKEWHREPMGLDPYGPPGVD